jgi:peptidoglycan/LPS O-acetylase OafA/YrhL
MESYANVPAIGKECTISALGISHHSQGSRRTKIDTKMLSGNMIGNQTVSRPAPRGTPQVPALDGVRGAAILIVMIHNACFILQVGNGFALKLVTSIGATGWVGVQLFFTLSGFLITGILLDARGSEGFFRTFYIRRTLRIFPLYYAFLALSFFVIPLFFNLRSWIVLARTNQWWFWGYASNWGDPFGHTIPGLAHFWSLAVEEQFYLLWPALVFLTAPRKLIRVCGAVIVATPVVRLLLHLGGVPTLALYEFTIARWDALAVGAVIAILMRDDSGRAWLRERSGTIGGTTLLILALFVALRHGFHEDDLPVQLLGQTLVALLAAWLVYVSVDPQSSVAESIRKGVSSRWLRFCGRYSYALYVLHFPVHQLAMRYLKPWVNTGGTVERLSRFAGYATALVAVSIVGALISWHTLEKPLLDLKDRLAPRRPPVPRTT